MRRSVLISLITVFVACGAVRSQQQQPLSREVEVEIQGFGKVSIPDIVVQDQDGRKFRFYSDLVKDKVVVLSFFYTSCTYACTLQGRTFAKLQSLLGERLGKAVFLISVSMDPANDNPQQLKAWARRYGVQSGWTLVTGEPAEMNKLLVPFTARAGGGGMHLPVTFIGNDKQRVWTGAVGQFAPGDLLKVVDFVTQ